MSFAALAFIAFLVFVFSNRVSEYGYESGFKVGFGSVFNFVISLATVICLSIFNKKFGYAIYQQNIKPQYNRIMDNHNMVLHNKMDTKIKKKKIN